MFLITSLQVLKGSASTWHCKRTLCQSRTQSLKYTWYEAAQEVTTGLDWKPWEADQSLNSSRYWQCACYSAAFGHTRSRKDFQGPKHRIEIFLIVVVNCYLKQDKQKTIKNTKGIKTASLCPSLEHELLEVIMENSILDIPEHQADVLRVDCSGEVVVQGLLLLVPALVPETFHQKFLDVS